MKKLTSKEMEEIVNGGKQPSAVACIGGAALGLAGIVLVGLGTAGAGVVAGSLCISFLSPVLGCLA